MTSESLRKIIQQWFLMCYTLRKLTLTHSRFQNTTQIMNLMILNRDGFHYLAGKNLHF